MYDLVRLSPQHPEIDRLDQLQIMPTLPVNDAGAVVYYEDSGVPNGSSDYTTIVMIHGFMFTSGTSPALPKVNPTAYRFRLLDRHLPTHARPCGSL